MRISTEIHLQGLVRELNKEIEALRKELAEAKRVNSSLMTYNEELIYERGRLRDERRMLMDSTTVAFPDFYKGRDVLMSIILCDGENVLKSVQAMDTLSLRAVREPDKLMRQAFLSACYPLVDQYLSERGFRP